MAGIALMNMDFQSSILQSASVSILENIQDAVNSITGLTARLIGRFSKSPFVHIGHTFWENASVLEHSPTFYLIAKLVQEDFKDALLIQIVTFNGKLLHQSPFKQKFTLLDFGNLWPQIVQSTLFNNFTRGEIQLCKGLPKSARKPGQERDVLRETLGDRVITRNRYCHYALIKSPISNCDACRSPTQQNPSDSSEIKSESEEVEDNDDYEANQDFLDNDDVRVVSITNGLPQKLTKLSGITICKSGASDTTVPSVTVTKTKSVEENPSFAEPQVNLTVMVNNGRQAKELPFNDFRKDLDIESEREKIRQPVTAGKRQKTTAEVTTSLDKKPKRGVKRGSLKTETEEAPSAPKTLRSANKRAGKNCPLCNQHFSDIADFMKHLANCDPAVCAPSDDDLGNDISNAFDSDEDFKPVLESDATKVTPTTSGSQLADLKPVIPSDPEEVPLFDRKRKKMKKKAPLPTGGVKKKQPAISVECTVCMTTFKQDTNFAAHMKAHEDKIDLSTPMECPVCSIEVESRKALNPHIKEHHPDKGGCCIECLDFMNVSILWL